MFLEKALYILEGIVFHYWKDPHNLANDFEATKKSF
jgi:hypothetical protein